MKVREAMTSSVEVVHPGQSLNEVAQKMRTLDAGVMPVCDGDRLVGMVTDRDITVRATGEDKASTTPVDEVMSGDIVYCFDDQDVEEAAGMMRDRQVRRLPVLNRDEQLVGIISLGDVATVTGDVNLAGETVRDISEDGDR